jgi:hypothetical protein
MKDENKNDIDHTTSEDRGPADLSFVIDDYRKQLYEMQQYKSQCIQLENQLKGSKGSIDWRIPAYLVLLMYWSTIIIGTFSL